MIKLENLTKYYGKKAVVNHINTRIDSGKITALVGPNGAGKTTTISMVCGALEPSEGKVWIDGIELEKDPMKAKEKFVLVPDMPDLFLRLSAREYIELLTALYNRNPEEIQKRLEMYADFFDLADLLDLKMLVYSHGIRQKALIAAALCIDPEILILDEPFSSLDPESIEQLGLLLRDRTKEGKSVFLTSHSLETAGSICDKVILINKGLIYYDGDLEKLKKLHPRCKNMQEIFKEVIRRDEFLKAL